MNACKNISTVNDISILFYLTSIMYLNKNWENFNFFKCKLKIINKKDKSEKLSPNFVNSIKKEKKEKLKECKYI